MREENEEPTADMLNDTVQPQLCPHKEGPVVETLHFYQL